MSVLLSFAPVVTDFPWWGVVLIVAAVLLVLLAIFLPIGTYFMAAVSKAHVSMSRLVGMKMRRIKYKQLVDVYIRARKAGLNIDISELESHVMAGGNVSNVVNALISAHSANIQLSLQSAKAIDLAGRDVLNAVRVSVNPKGYRNSRHFRHCQKRHRAARKGKGDGAGKHIPSDRRRR